MLAVVELFAEVQCYSLLYVALLCVTVCPCSIGRLVFIEMTKSQQGSANWLVNTFQLNILLSEPRKVKSFDIFAEKVTGSIDRLLKQLIINIFMMDLSINYLNVAAIVSFSVNRSKGVLRLLT